MAKDPAVLFYTSDFLTGVTDLTMEERGQYITMLCLQHQKGRLSEKTIRLCVGSVSVDVMSKFQKDENGNFFSERMEREIQERIKFTESRRNNGRLGGRPKIEKPIGYPNGKPNGKPTQNLPEDENENENIDTNKRIKYKIPAKEEFLEYAKQELEKIGKKYDEYKYSLDAKYDTWVDDGWKDGHGNKITNWKNKVRIVITHLKPMEVKTEKPKIDFDKYFAEYGDKPISELL